MSTVDPWVYNNYYLTQNSICGCGPILNNVSGGDGYYGYINNVPLWTQRTDTVVIQYTPSVLNYDTEDEESEEDVSYRRIVKRYVIDKTEEIVADGIPIDAFIVYEDAEEFLTDANDTELERDLDLKGILVKQNERRATLLDEEASKEAKTPIYLKPIRQRDLKVLVRTMFSF